MEHVPTLCALSTVGIAATGFALGRVDQDPPKPGRFHKKILPLQDPRARATDNPLSPRSDVIPPEPSPSVASPGSRFPSISNNSRADNDITHQEGLSEAPFSRRKSSLAGIILRRRGKTLSIPPPQPSGDTLTASHSRRPSSSWVRRLSFQPENRWSCQSPVSPSFNANSSPVQSRPSSQRRVPNKLVKRPPSQHSPLTPTPPSSSTSTILRRPATSYQRSENLKHRPTHSLNFEPSLASSFLRSSPSTPHPGDNDGWQPYLRSTSDELSERSSRRFSTATQPKDGVVRRILPSVDTVPTLVLATAVTTMGSMTDADPARPATQVAPVQFRDPFKPVDIAPQESEPGSDLKAEDPPLPQSNEADPRTRETNIGPGDAEISSDTSLISPKRRAISTPLPNWPKQEGTVLLASRPPERRNITDPSVFHVPPNSSQSETSIPFVPGRATARHRFVPSYSRIDMDHRGTWQRPLSSDTSAMSSFHGSIRQRSKRHSIAASDPASTILGSDDTRIFTSGDEDETDFLSDTAFDSIRTHLTANSSIGIRTPRIETIFDKEFSLDFTDEGQLGGKNSGSHCAFDSTNNANLIPELAGHCEEPDLQEDDSRISFPSDLSDDEDARSLVAALPSESNRHIPCSHTGIPSRDSNRHGARDVLFAYQKPEVPLNIGDSDSQSLTNEAYDSSPKMNIFDWSEQPKSDREVAGSEERPRTVHGKHGPQGRGSRAPGRKAPNTLHLRSQSVPVSRENSTNTESRQTSGKFGTWGLGTKGVSEDWESDFEFEDADESAISETLRPNKPVPRRGMIVPEAIMERQASLHGQFGQVQELTLLVEELKRLRHQASFLGVVHGPSSDLWKEAEGIVNLATLDEDHDQSPPGSPSSLTFSFDDSEGESSNVNEGSKRVSGGSWPNSYPEQFNPSPTTPGPEIKEDTSKPNSVLDLIYQQRVSHDPALMGPHLARSKKLPFDTQSLHDLVNRAGAVTRALKEVIRKAEGVSTDHEGEVPRSDPPFSRIFEQPSSTENLPPLETRCIA